MNDIMPHLPLPPEIAHAIMEAFSVAYGEGQLSGDCDPIIKFIAIHYPDIEDEYEWMITSLFPTGIT